MEPGKGQVFNDTYVPQTSDLNWLGLHKAGGQFASYIAVSTCRAEGFQGPRHRKKVWGGMI